MRPQALLGVLAGLTYLGAAQICPEDIDVPCKGIEFNLVMELYDGTTTTVLPIEAIGSSVIGVLNIVGRPYDPNLSIECPAYLNSTEYGSLNSGTATGPVGALNFDFAQQDVTPYIPGPGICGITVPISGYYNGTFIPVKAIYGIQDFFFAVHLATGEISYTLFEGEPSRFYACNTTMDGEKHTFVLSWGLPQDDGRTPPDGCQAATVYQSSVIEGGATFEDQLDGTLHC